MNIVQLDRLYQSTASPTERFSIEQALCDQLAAIGGRLTVGNVTYTRCEMSQRDEPRLLVWYRTNTIRERRQYAGYYSFENRRAPIPLHA